MTTVRLNVFSLLKQLEIAQGHDLDWSDVSRKSKITRQTWLRMRNNVGDGIDFATIAKLLDYFRQEGLEVGVADLFVVGD